MLNWHDTKLSHPSTNLSWAVFHFRVHHQPHSPMTYDLIGQMFGHKYYLYSISYALKCTLFNCLLIVWKIHKKIIFKYASSSILITHEHIGSKMQEISSDNSKCSWDSWTSPKPISLRQISATNDSQSFNSVPFWSFLWMVSMVGEREGNVRNGRKGEEGNMENPRRGLRLLGVVNMEKLEFFNLKKKKLFF